eukprot:3585775-Alexandrium_andersonii.AAC.1
MSAGRLADLAAGSPSAGGRPGSKPAFSRSGLAPASTASLQHTLRSSLCLTVRSPWHGQTSAWSPHRSKICPQQGQGVSPSATGQRSRRFSATLNKGASISLPSGTGGAVSHAPAPGTLTREMCACKAPSAPARTCCLSAASTSAE